MRTRNYSIHGIINFQIKNLTGPIKRRFDETLVQFENFASNNSDSPDFTVEMGQFSREDSEKTILDDTFHIGDGYIYYRGKRKLSKWEIEISGLESSPKIKIDTNFVGNITMPLNVVELLIQYCLLRKGVSIIHASGISDGEKCVAFAARSGAGKTTIALSLVDKGFSYLGDNFVLLENKVARNYICPLNVFTYNRLPIVEKALGRKQKFSMFAKKQLYTFTRGYFKVFEKINPANIFGDLVVDSQSICLICFLEVNSALAREELNIKQVSRDELIKKLRYNMELDLLSFSKCIHSYGYMYPNKIFPQFWETYEKVLSDNLPEDASAISVEVPRRWDKSMIDKIEELLGQYLT